MALNAKDLDMMKNAVDSGADADMMLFRGIEKSQLEWVKAAVEHGADVHASRRGLSAGSVLSSSEEYPVFFWLAENFDSSIGDYLLSKGAKIDAPSRKGDSALMAAVRLQRTQSIKYLVDRDADPLLPCADQKIPLKVLQDDGTWFDSSKKFPIIKAMMENTKRRHDFNTAALPANDVAAAPPATDEAIEVSRPIEFKRKPPAGFTL
jgi:ankyrin repeat protein